MNLGGAIAHRTWTSLFVLATFIASGCTYNKSFLDLQLERAIKAQDYDSVSPPEHFITPGAIAVVDDDEAKLVCDWPNVYSDLPAIEREKQIQLSEKEKRGLEVRARHQAVVRALEAYYAVGTVVIGPVTETRIALVENSQQVTTRCAQQVRDAIVREGPDDPPRLVSGTITADITYQLIPISEKLAQVIKPIIPEIVRAFGSFQYRPEANTLSGRLVLGVSAAGLPAQIMSQVQVQMERSPPPRDTSLAGLWVVSKWKEPSITQARVLGYSSPKISGTLTIAEPQSNGSYQGILSLVINDKKSVLEEIAINRDGDTVKMEGRVIEGDWIADKLTMRMRGSSELVGTATSEGVNGTTQVVFTKSVE